MSPQRGNNVPLIDAENLLREKTRMKILALVVGAVVGLVGLTLIV